MTYPQTIQYLESFVDYEKISAYPYKESLRLERVKDFLTLIGNPQDSLKCIHIAGTKGKGSACAFIAYILRQAGYRVGLYTSPHLSDFRERIRILECQSVKVSKCQGTEDFEGMISQEDLTLLTERLKPAIQNYNKRCEYGPLSFFEVYTSLAFVYFKEKSVDFTVLETGLGGRLDATNVVNPLVAAITPISYEHTQKLGNTLKEIAAEKAGIIKVSRCQGVKVSRSVVISAPQEDEALGVIRNRCKTLGARLLEVGKDILVTAYSLPLTAYRFKVKGISGEYANLKIRLLGKHQLINAAVAVGVIEALRVYNIDVGMDAIRGGLYNTLWPGRCEVISPDPLIVLDGAQNIASTQALKKTVKENFQYKRLILVLGISSDKDIKGICSELYELADEIILTKADNPRASEPEVLAQYFPGKKIHMTDGVKEAKALARRLSQKEDLILVCGSLFVVGDFRNDRIRP
ncbi:MAG: bifunctional folylpolyglutamate synthase/dihydrofolate synthase [Candidatus Omnitrophica bacterium]|nr:bifunctional folylpolyglutamate synthase/dihydrofolate synthase [Candidatus Omnitrophota bacterium]MDD5593059.1 bifunctional folylpolyglutamate synthase/dihydrofolate synthase [Candidatus Omnitrophota bacterium]